MKDFQPFAMERYMSAYEQEVDFNLSESGVQPMLLRELLDLKPGSIERMFGTDLNYPHANGIPELRQNIAAMYQEAGPENVLVTVGAIEGNYNSIRTMLDAGDEIVIMLPNYMQIWGIARNHGLKIKTFSLKEDQQWSPDLNQLEEVVSEDTKLIAICNPNNPTGYILTEEEMQSIVKISERFGTWILADEVYSGVEQYTDQQTPSFYGLYDRVLAIGSMSKAYGLPGLRTGWVVCRDREVINNIWSRHEYNTISAGMMANHLAAIALSEEVRPAVLQRARSYVRKGFSFMEQWMNQQKIKMRCVPPRAAAIAWIKYEHDINSTDLCTKLIHSEPSVLIVPGDHFGIDQYLRISFGLEEEYLSQGLAAITKVLNQL
jgi:aspartate/methionine/tyrosine aminotransferase